MGDRVGASSSPLDRVVDDATSIPWSLSDIRYSSRSLLVPACMSLLRPSQFLRRTLLLVGVIGAVGVLTGPCVSLAQQKIGYVDTEYVLNKMPEYETVQQKLDNLEQEWRQEIQKKEKKARTLEQEFNARELLYTEEERKQKQRAIETARNEVEQLRQRYFGPEGELYSRQKELMRPIQQRVLEATESVATEDGYDYVVDKKGETLFLYAKEEHDLSDRVLRELGINIEQDAPQGNNREDAQGAEPNQ